MSTPSSFQRKVLLKSTVAGASPRTEKWVLAELNDIWEQLKMEFVMWYYYLMDLLEALKVATDGFGNFLLEYKNRSLIDKFVNCAAMQHVIITAPPKIVAPSSMRGNFVDRA